MGISAIRRGTHVTTPRRPGTDPVVGAVAIGGALLVSGVLSALWSPAPVLNPRIRRYYERLEKPSFHPPDYAFAVWGPLWTMLGASAWRLWQAPPSEARTRALAHWFAAQGLNAAWLWIGFGERNRGAMAIEGAMSVVNAAALVDAARHVDGKAALLSVPYLAWIGYVALISEEYWRLNQDRRI